MTQSGNVRANTMHSALLQALRTDDQKLLEQCILARVSEDVVKKTVQALPVQYVVSFLNSVVKFFQDSPSRGLTVVRWIRIILSEHLSYLMTVPNIVHTLSGLYLMVNSRLDTNKSILKLSGRLDLVLAQVAKTHMGPESSAAMNVIAEDENGDVMRAVAHGSDDMSDFESGSDNEMEVVTGPAAGNEYDSDDDSDSENEIFDDDYDDDDDDEELLRLAKEAVEDEEMGDEDEDDF